MIKKEHGSVGKQLLLRGLAASIIIFVFLVVFAVIYVVKAVNKESFAQGVQSAQVLYWEKTAIEGSAADSAVSSAISSIITFATMNLTLYTTLIGILIGTLLLLLGTLIYQMHLRTLDLKKIDQWRESGFLCERLEFLPANRIKLNNLELELNKAQIENLKKLAHHRIIGKPLHSVDMGDHAVQSIKRLREELGAKFIEKSLVKVRTKEGYWLEVDSGGIYGLPPLAEKS